MNILLAALLGLILVDYSAAAYFSSPDSNDFTKPTLIPSATPPPATPTPYCPETYIELRVDKPIVEVGQVFTLTLIYHNLGEPYTMIGLTPEGLAEFDPPITEWPCKYDCDIFTLRALAVGQLEISAGATGEVYCNGWMWSGGHSKTPAVVQITPRAWRVFLPLIDY